MFDIQSMGSEDTENPERHLLRHGQIGWANPKLTLNPKTLKPENPKP